MSRLDQLPPFFERHGLGRADWQKCLLFVQQRYPEHIFEDEVKQGGCSYTIKLTRSSAVHASHQDDTFIIQFRPDRYALSTETASLAKRWYGGLAPSVTKMRRFITEKGDKEVVAYRMACIPGRRFDELRPQSKSLSPGMLLRYHNLLDDLAAFYAKAWRYGLSDARRRCDGKVGLTILWRLRELEAKLPSPVLRSKASSARYGVEAGLLDRVPVVFTHGDLLPSNILVDESTWHINGLVDWTESEYLPFGMNLYGLEHLLGNLSSATSGTRYVYLDEAESLRQYFWQRLTSAIPELKRRSLRQVVELARTVGILLWRGFAWDDGKVNRVADAVKDPEELAYLEAFLESEAHEATARL